MIPADLRKLVDLTEREARAGVARFTETGAAEGARLVEDWAARIRQLSDRWQQGHMDTFSLRKALESEREALALRLAALANNQVRSFIAGVLDIALTFIGRLLAA